MNIWDYYNGVASATLLCWVIAAILLLFTKKELLATLLTIAGLLIFGSFIAMMWISLERPPLRTMGETRLWYSFFLVGVGYIIYLKWKFNWVLVYSLLVASIFVVINILKPEIHSKNLMPALQSIWFVPHVTAYILSYSILGAATILSFKLLLRKSSKADDELISFTDNLVYIGFGLLMLAMLMGAVWAKEAWGHYWSWDPKETWAFITAAAYVAYFHLRWKDLQTRTALWLLQLAFVFLMITWKGVNYLPSAKNSVHVYTQQD